MAVPIEDLPNNLVPQSDLPSSIAKEPSALDFLKASTRLTPLGIGPKVNSSINDLLNKAAYKAGGAVTDVAGPEAGFATNVAIQSAPMLLGGALGMKAAPVLEGVAKALMKSAVKPTAADLASGDAGAAIDTMLKRGIPPTAEGMSNLRKQISSLDEQVKNLVGSSSENITVGKVGQSLTDSFQRFIRAGHSEDISAIKRAWDAFKNHPLIAGVSEIPVQIAQSIKTAKSSLLPTRAYGELGAADTAAEKGLIHGLKTEIEAKVPGVIPLNKLNSELRNVKDVAERKALQEYNKDPGGIGWLVHSPESFTAFTLGRSAQFKGMLARILYGAQEEIPGIIGASAGGLYGSSLNAPAPASQGGMIPQEPIRERLPGMQGVRG